MNVDLLYSKIKNPTILKQEDISIFRDLTEKFPYSQIFSILYLKALAKNKDLHFEDELQKHAFKVADRTKLYEIIQENEIVQEEVNLVQTIVQVESKAIEHLDLPEKNFEVENQVFEKEIIEQVSEKQDSPIEIEVVSVEMEEEKIQAKETIAESQPIIQDEKIDELEKEFLSNIIASSYSIEQEEKKLKQASEKANVQQVKVDINQTRSFTSWLKISENASEESTEKPVIAKIIDRFIREEPEKIKPKADFYSAPKKAKESVKDDKLIYTETLANIYALQGNYAKALTAFEQLAFNNPEKKEHFEHKIKEIKGKMNS